MDVSRLRGSLVPVITPFADDGQIDQRTLERLIDWQIASGSHGISVTGTTGEPSALSLDERRLMLDLAKSAINGRVPFVPATGTNNIDETIALTQYAERLGVDAALIIVPYYNRPSQEGLFRFFRAVSQSVELPLIIYNIPGRTATNMLPETMLRLREACPNIVGVKESNKDFEHVSKVLHTCGRDFLVYSGIELLCYPMLAIGGVGHVSATGNILPREVAAIYDLVVAGRWQEAMDLHYRLLPLNEALFLETNPGPLKWAMGELGWMNGMLKLPLCEPSPANQAKIRAALAQYDLSNAPIAKAVNA